MNESIQEYCKKGKFPPREVLNQKFKCPVIVVYRNSSDFIGKYVARIWDLEDKSIVPKHFIVKDTLREVQEQIPINMKWFERDAEDDPCIVGTYI